MRDRLAYDEKWMMPARRCRRRRRASRFGEEARVAAANLVDASEFGEGRPIHYAAYAGHHEVVACC